MIPELVHDGILADVLPLLLLAVLAPWCASLVLLFRILAAAGKREFEERNPKKRTKTFSLIKS